MTPVRRRAAMLAEWTADWCEANLPTGAPYCVRLVRQIATVRLGGPMEYRIDVDAGPAPFKIPTRAIVALESLPDEWARAELEKELFAWRARW